MQLTSLAITGLISVASARSLFPRGVECDYEFPADSGDSCVNFAAGWGLSADEFIQINSGVACPNLEAGKLYCVIGRWTPDVSATAPSSQIQSTSATLRTSTVTVPLPSTTASATAAPSNSPTMPGIAPTCDRFHKIVSGGNCEAIAQKNGITVGQLKSRNTEIDTTNSPTMPGIAPTCNRFHKIVSGDNCETMAQKAGITVAHNSPLLPGTAPNCNAFYKIVSGDSCEIIAQKNSITLAQFRSWNTEINAACNNLLLDYYVCVRVPGPSVLPSVTTSAVATPTNTPSPAMPGIVGNCNRFYKVASGDGRDSIAQKAGITVANFKRWNTFINTAFTNLWLDYYVCTRAP
ncbi:hypothetical protein QBC35DRAFT_537994 [Podospora australis]|uniref:LysM domain-containing protein n=1 Tax=Podospora australis TaxID=1536484 RepID=A0AAN6WN63_9PEZI|nr:hypothetical protein QBC35DRAFT_537994 [Podospora australis]